MMKKIKIAHEAPKSIFRRVQKFTDYDYALVHLFEEDEEYYKMFEDAIAEGREVILDNSIFELGTAFDPEKFVYWINKLKPAWYIVPDSLENCQKTKENMKDWVLNYKHRVTAPSKMIGVVQGKNYEEILECFKFMANMGVDKIGIPFDFSYYETSVPHPNKLVSWMLGRVKLLGDLTRDIKGPNNKMSLVHLLGCALPQEGLFYSGGQYDFIDSQDTSNPVVHGLKKIKYSSIGLNSKSSEKLYTLINHDTTLGEWSAIRHNLKYFRAFWTSWDSLDSLEHDYQEIAAS